MTPESPIHVAFVCDDRYAMPLAAALASIQAALSADRRLAVHVLEAGFSPALRERVAVSLGSDRGELHWYAVDATRFAGLRRTLRSFDQVSLASYFRLLIGHYLPPEVSKVIYLDCDIVLESDLARLWEENLDGCLLAAVPESGPRAARAGDPAGIFLHRELGLAPDTPLFNSGVMVLDLARWRVEQAAERCLSYLQAAGNEVLWHDQEALNVIAVGDWKPLDARWNVMMHAFRGGRAHESGERLRRNPWILHFNSARKPWHAEFELGCEDRFFHYLDQTAWAGWRPARASPCRRWVAAAQRALLKRVDRARRASRRLRGAMRTLVREKRVLFPRLRLLAGTPVTGTEGEEIRAFLVLDHPSVCHAAADYLLARGVDRVIAAVPDLPPAAVPGTAPGSLSPDGARAVHVYRWNPARHSFAEMLLRLLDAFGDGCWCVLPGYEGDRAASPATAGAREALDLRRQVASLEGEGVEGLLAATELHGASLLTVEGFSTDLLSGRLLRSTVLVEPLTAHAAGRIVLLKWRRGMRLAADLSTVPGIPLARLPARHVPRRAPP